MFLSTYDRRRLARFCNYSRTINLAVGVLLLAGLGMLALSGGTLSTLELIAGTVLGAAGWIWVERGLDAPQRKAKAYGYAEENVPRPLTKHQWRSIRCACPKCQQKRDWNKWDNSRSI